MKAKRLCSMFAVVTMLAMIPLQLSAKTLGMVANSGSVTVFDADIHAILGTVPIAADNVRITPDLKRGLATNHGFKVFVIDLTTSPPSLAGGTNPIPISNNGEDLAISPDGKFLMVVGGAGTASISVIDIAAQAEISTFSPDSGIHSVDVCSDGSVLTASFSSGAVRRLTLSAAGTLTDTGEVLSVSEPANVYCAPGALSGVVIPYFPEEITSFTIPGLTLVHTRSLSTDNMLTGAISRAGDRVFVRGFGLVDVFDFTQATGALGASPLLTFSLALNGGASSSGFDQIAVHPNGGKLFVSESENESFAVNVYNPSTGALID
jgi:DNA-binding beta-propeller fold protein YncE